MTPVIQSQTDHFGRDTRRQEFDIAEFMFYSLIRDIFERITRNGFDGFFVEYAVARFITKRETYYLHN